MFGVFWRVLSCFFSYLFRMSLHFLLHFRIFAFFRISFIVLALFAVVLHSSLSLVHDAFLGQRISWPQIVFCAQKTFFCTWNVFGPKHLKPKAPLAKGISTAKSLFGEKEYFCQRNTFPQEIHSFAKTHLLGLRKYFSPRKLSLGQKVVFGLKFL